MWLSLLLPMVPCSSCTFKKSCMGG
jgi:hypothetical protein